MNKQAQSPSISFKAIWRAVQRRKLFILIPVVVLTPAVAFYVHRMPAKYRAQAVVGSAPIMQDRLTFGNRPDVAAQLTAQDQIRAVREVLLNDANLTRVNDEFHLYPANTPQEKEKMIAALKEQIGVQIEGTDSFDLQFIGNTPQQVADVANRLAQLFTLQTATLRDTRAGQQDTFLDSEVARARQKVEQEEGAVKSIRQSGAQQAPERYADNLKEYENLQQQIAIKNDQITDAEAKRSADKAELSEIEKQGVNTPEPVEKSPTEVQIDELRRKLAQLKARYTPEHPEVLRTEKEIRDLQASSPAKPVVTHKQPSEVQMRYVALQAELKSIDPKIAAYKQEIASLQAQQGNYQHVIDASPGYETTLTARMRDVSDARAAYEALLVKQQEAHLNHKVEKDAGGPTYRVLEPAQVPDAPFSPHKSRIILMAIVASLALGVGGIVLAERMDTTFETGEDFERFTDIPLLSTIPSISSTQKRKTRGSSKVAVIRPMEARFTTDANEHFFAHRIAVLSDPDSIASQQYGILALKVQKWMAQSGGKTLVITSSTGEEGKSLTALNLAFALASSIEGGVLLVDCDLRLPQVRERLGLESEQGLADLLASGSPKGEDLRQYISRVGDLDVMPAGTDSVKRTHLLASPRGREVFARLREKYRIVVLDSPPVVPIADSHALSELADGVVMVLRARRTRPDLFQRALTSLEAKNLVGVVLNDVEYAATPYAYAYRYYQQHYVGRK